ncbi:hypothetical protein LNQ03_08500 [Klebsiella pneumoniae subsp. pneumoniae]|nr:hypothetical protein [Klebsiella pneumoniae subsp. pneumoniae]
MPGGVHLLIDMRNLSDALVDEMDLLQLRAFIAEVEPEAVCRWPLKRVSHYRGGAVRC